MAKYKAYPEYKDSGMEWCTALPIGWKRTNLRWLSSIYAGGTPSKNVIDYWENGTVPWINSGAVNQSYVTEPSTFISKAAFENSSAKWIPKGALVVALAGQGKTKGMVAQLGINTTCNQSMAAIVFYEKKLSRYIYWWLTSNYQNIRNMAGGDLRDGLNLELLGDIQCPQPNGGECIRISAFLDHETAKIDNLIEKQQQLIELLKEKRQAVISHAVTKGLNPDVPMKDSGVKWLGEVPEHWGITRLKYECRNIVDCPHSTPNYTDEGEYPAIRTADILAGYLDLENCRRVTEPVYDERNFRLIPKAGDIIYSREGERFGIGAPIPEGAKVCLAQRVMLFRAKSTPGYLMWALNSSFTYTQAQQDCIGSTSPHVNVDTIKNFILAWPPENEREEISNFIHQTLDSIESLTVHLTEKLTLLQERRTALISAAVTGKIDVRDWVAPDPQDVEESEEATA
jgi:type I restriction enzyme, S subunit